MVRTRWRQATVGWLAAQPGGWFGSFGAFGPFQRLEMEPGGEKDPSVYTMYTRRLWRTTYELCRHLFPVEDALPLKVIEQKAPWSPISGQVRWPRCEGALLVYENTVARVESSSVAGIPPSLLPSAAFPRPPHTPTPHALSGGCSGVADEVCPGLYRLSAL